MAYITEKERERGFLAFLRLSVTLIFQQLHPLRNVETPQHYFIQLRIIQQKKDMWPGIAQSGVLSLQMKETVYHQTHQYSSFGFTVFALDLYGEFLTR